jgi:hypothetical protein
MTVVNAEMRVAGRYRLGPSLGAGGMGRVWLARDELLQRDVAIKQIALPFGLSDADRAELRARSLREARAAARLNHPNVVKIYDVVHGEEQPWIVMEYVQSRSLLQVIDEGGPLPVGQVAEIGLAVLSALDAANRVGVVHRDVKPSNVLIADDGRVVLTDFGSAILDEGEGAITQTGVILGSPQYIAPERAYNGVSTPESDLWSLGATLYAAVEGHPPYHRPTAMATLIALATKRPDPMRRAGALKPVIRRLLQKDPLARLTAAQAQTRLRQVVEADAAPSLSAVPPPRRSPEPAPSVRGEQQGGLGAALAAAFGMPMQDASTPAERVAAPEPAPVSTGAGPAPAATATAPAPRSGTARRARTAHLGRRWYWVAAGVVLLILVAATAVAVRPDDTRPPSTADAADGPATDAADGPATAGAGSVGAVAPATSAPVVTPAAPPVDPDALPTGFTWWQHPTGFRVAIPARWEMIPETGGNVFFCDPRAPLTLRAHPWDRSDPDPTAALVAEEARANLPGYRRIRIEALPQGNGSEWEYTYAGGRGRLHGIERGFVVFGRAFLIQWRTPENDWAGNLARWGVIDGSFRPPARLPTNLA